MALVEDPDTPFFTIDHFKGYNAVLVQQSRLGELSRDELAEIITDAWAARPEEAVKAALRRWLRPDRRAAGGARRARRGARGGCLHQPGAPGRDRTAPARPARRGPHHRARLRHDPPAGHLRRGAGRLLEPPAGQGRSRRPRRPRLGAHQLLNMRVPPHAAISTSVDLVKARGKTSAAGFVNAVLRKVSVRDLEELAGPGRSGPRHPAQPSRMGGRGAAPCGRGCRARGPARRRQRAAQGDPRGPARTRGAGRAAGCADAVLALRSGAGRRQPGRGAGGGRGSRRCPGRGFPAGGAGALPAPGSRGRTPLARPVCRARWEVRAVGRAGRRARCRPHGRRASAPPRPPGGPGAGRCRGRHGTADRRRHHPTAAPGVVRPGPRRRALHRPRRAPQTT